VFSLVRQPRWLGLLALALVLCLLFWWLGLWQWHRHFARADLNAAVEAAQSQPVQPLTQVMPDPGTLPDRAEHRRVSASGHYLADAQMLQRNADGRAGFAVITPLRLDSGGTLLVDRGFVPFSLSSADAPASDVTPPSGEVTVQVRLRAAQEGSNRAAPAGQIYSITPDEYPLSLQAPVYASYGDLVEQSPPPSDDLELPPLADIGMGPHLFYALQWWSFIAIALIGYVVLLRREAAGHEAAADRSSRSDDTPAGLSSS
jgi:cytochrome oxidase assembly protein ShyY1